MNDLEFDARAATIFNLPMDLVVEIREKTNKTSLLAALSNANFFMQRDVTVHHDLKNMDLDTVRGGLSKVEHEELEKNMQGFMIYADSYKTKLGPYWVNHGGFKPKHHLNATSILVAAQCVCEYTEKNT